jgi:hypothetical protein
MPKIFPSVFLAQAFHPTPGIACSGTTIVPRVFQEKIGIMFYFLGNVDRGVFLSTRGYDII